MTAIHVCGAGCRPGTCPAIWIPRHDRTRVIQYLITQAADQAGIDPDRISFKSALDAARRSAGSAISPPADQTGL